MAAYGPARLLVRSSTTRPSSEPAIACLPRMCAAWRRGVIRACSARTGKGPQMDSAVKDGAVKDGQDHILVEHNTTGIVTVTLNKPEKRNAMSYAMWQGLGDIYTALGKRTDVRAVILTGTGGNFCAGADISEFSKVRNSEESARVYNVAGEFATDA